MSTLPTAPTVLFTGIHQDLVALPPNTDLPYLYPGTMVGGVARVQSGVKVVELLRAGWDCRSGTLLFGPEKPIRAAFAALTSLMSGVLDTEFDPTGWDPSGVPEILTLVAPIKTEDLWSILAEGDGNQMPSPVYDHALDLLTGVSWLMCGTALDDLSPVAALVYATQTTLPLGYLDQDAPPDALCASASLHLRHLQALGPEAPGMDAHTYADVCSLIDIVDTEHP